VAAVSLDYLVGIMFATIQTLLSGFGAIFFEKVLKSKSGAGLEDLSVWDRNIQLALYSILIYLPAAVYETSGDVLQVRETN
jgi:solute carrier family 35 (UDP-sugar transporter), member A1/2/3